MSYNHLEAENLEQQVTASQIFKRRPRWVTCVTFAVAVLLMVACSISIGLLMGYTYCYIEYRSAIRSESLHSAIKSPTQPLNLFSHTMFTLFSFIVRVTCIYVILEFKSTLIRGLCLLCLQVHASNHYRTNVMYEMIPKFRLSNISEAMNVIHVMQLPPSDSPDHTPEPSNKTINGALMSSVLVSRMLSLGQALMQQDDNLISWPQVEESL